MLPDILQKTVKTHRSPLTWMRLLTLLFILASMLGGVIVVIHQLIPVKAAAGDWPTFLHDPQRTAAGSDTTISTSNASQLAVKWTFKTGGPIAASPTIVGGVVYVGSWDGYEYALNATTGALLWKTFLGQTTAPCYPQLAGVSSAADVENGVVYVGGGDSYWYALDATTGNVLWKIFVGDNTKGWYNWASPLIYNGYAYIGTSSVGDCPLIPGQLLQVSLSTHQIVNTFNAVPAGQVGAGIWTSPSIDPSTNTIFVTTGTRNQDTQTLAEAIIALDANTLAVKSSWAIPNSMQTVDSDFGNTPLLFNDSQGNPLVTAVNKNGIDYAWNRNNLAAGPVWTQNVTLPGSCPQCGDGSASSGAFANGTLFQAGGSTVINGVGYRGSVRALNPNNGNILWQHADNAPVIPGLAYSNGLIFDGTGSSLEVLDASSGTRLYSYTTGGYLYAAPSVSNGQVYTGGTDDNVYAFGLATPSTPPADVNCPTGWTCQDIGTPTPAGTETASGASWSVQAGGAGVSGTSDQFRLISQTVSGDSQISAQVVSQQATSGAAQAGLMVRQSNDPTSPYYAAFLEPNKTLVVQYRTAFGGATTTVTQANVTPPLYIEIQRLGDNFQTATSSTGTGTSYTLVPGSSAPVVMPAAVMEGVAAASGTQGSANTVSYNAVTPGLPTTSPNPPPSSSPCPSSWSCQDIGNPLTPGNQSLSNGAWTLAGAGQSINNYGDQFHFVWQSLAADGAISAHITSQTNTNASAQAGVMLRQSTDPIAPYYAAFITPGNGILVQYRLIQGLKTTVFYGPSSTVPVYLMVARSGSNYCTYTSSDGANWSVIIGSCETVNLSGSVLAGLAVSSDNAGSLSTVAMDTVTISTTAPPPPNICTGAWTCADIGYPSLAGNQYLIGGTWTVQGSGSDIWSTFDQFRYVWQQLAADGAVSAHITSQDNTDLWAKAGVMMRLTTDPGSPYYAILTTPGNGIVVQYRTTQGGFAQQSGQITTGTVPTYLMVERVGTTYSAFTSSDGNTWTLVPGSSVTISSMTGSIMAGMAVTSHNGGLMGSATFDTVNISSSLLCLAGWTCADIGNPTPAGTQSVSNGTWTVQAGGADIYGTSDQFHYIWQQLASDGSVSAQVVSQTNTSSNAKAGVMLRLTSDPGSPFYDAVVTPSHSIYIQYRKNQGGSAQQSTTLTTLQSSIYLMVARTGTTFTAYYSSDGINWTLVPGSSVTLSTMTGTLLAGIAATSHNTTKLSTVVFNTVNVSTCLVTWNCADIGNPTPSGNQSESGGTWTVTAGGNDIWGTSDTFHFVWQPLASNGVVDAQVTSQSSSDPWAKAGVMLRQSSDPGSMYYGVFATPGNGIVVQYRNAQGGGTNQVMISGTAPVYLAVQRSGTTFTAYTSADGSTWTQVAGSSVTINMTGTLLAGLAATSHNSNILATIVFNSVSVSTGGLPVKCPTGWSCADIGNPALAGSQSVSGSTWTITAGGTDIWNTSDQFHYVWQPLAADGSVSAQVVSQSNSSSWAKAGVMIRQNSTAGSAYYFAMVTPSNGVVIQYRSAAGAKSQTQVSISGNVPVYLAVARTGTTFTAYTSSDGVNWTAVSGSSVTINMTGSVLAGLAVTSHNANVLGTVTLNTVNVGTTIP